MTEFYKLDTTFKYYTQSYAGGQITNLQYEVCSTCKTELRISNKELEVQLNYVGRAGFTEFLWTSHNLPIFRSDLVALWQEIIPGQFDTKPVRITGWYEKPSRILPTNIPTYLLVMPKSEVRLQIPKPVGDPCSTCGFVLYNFPRSNTPLPDGIEVDPSTTRGMDIVKVIGYNYLLCTRKLAEVTLRKGFNRRIVFVKQQDYLRWEQFNLRKDWTIQNYKKYESQFLIRDERDL